MMGSNQSRRCNLRVVLDGAESPRRERKAVRSRPGLGVDSAWRFGSIGFKGLVLFFP